MVCCDHAGVPPVPSALASTHTSGRWGIDPPHTTTRLLRGLPTGVTTESGGGPPVGDNWIQLGLTVGYCKVALLVKLPVALAPPAKVIGVGVGGTNVTAMLVVPTGTNGTVQDMSLPL